MTANMTANTPNCSPRVLHGKFMLPRYSTAARHTRALGRLSITRAPCTHGSCHDSKLSTNVACTNARTHAHAVAALSVARTAGEKGPRKALRNCKGMKGCVRARALQQKLAV